jgi:hypothetical protein
MKTLKMVCTAMILALMLSMPGRAGEISSPGFTGDDPKPGVTETTSNPAVPASPNVAPGGSLDTGLAAVLMTLAALF